MQGIEAGTYMSMTAIEGNLTRCGLIAKACRLQVIAIKANRDSCLSKVNKDSKAPASRENAQLPAFQDLL